MGHCVDDFDHSSSIWNGQWAAAPERAHVLAFNREACRSETQIHISLALPSVLPEKLLHKLVCRHQRNWVWNGGCVGLHEGTHMASVWPYSCRCHMSSRCRARHDPYLAICLCCLLSNLLGLRGIWDLVCQLGHRVWDVLGLGSRLGSRLGGCLGGLGGGHGGSCLADSLSSLLRDILGLGSCIRSSLGR